MAGVTRRLLEAQPHRLTVRRQVLGRGQGQHVARDLFESGLVVVDDVDASQECLHATDPRLCRAEPGWAERGWSRRSSRRGSPASSRPRRWRPHCVPARRRQMRSRLDLEVLGSVRVHDPQTLIDVVHQNDSGLRAGQGLADALAVFGPLHLDPDPASTASASAALSVTRTDAAITSCSAWLIMSAATLTGLAESSARIAISVGPASNRYRPRCGTGVLLR